MNDYLVMWRRRWREFSHFRSVSACQIGLSNATPRGGGKLEKRDNAMWSEYPGRAWRGRRVLLSSAGGVCPIGPRRSWATLAVGGGAPRCISMTTSLTVWPGRRGCERKSKIKGCW
jgi:hypothetical protein